jgi:hypothetical protein
MSRHVARCLAVTLVLATAFTACGAGAAPRPKKGEPAAPAAAAVDKRDRVVTAPGTAFHGRAFWQATALCGGIYFRVNTIHSEAAISAKVIKPDPAAYQRLTKQADVAGQTATMFFEATEQFLVADRKIARDDAVLTYDPVAGREGDRFKTVDAAMQAAKPCPELYRLCRAAHPQTCADPTALTN